MKAMQQLAMLALFVCTGAQLLAQATPGSADKGGGRHATMAVQPDHRWLHCARRNFLG